MTAADFKQGTATVNLRLHEDGEQLQTVTIDAARVKKIAEEDFSTDIFDFEFADGKILLLLREKKKYILRMTTTTGRETDHLVLPYPARRIHRSCLNSLHVVGDSRAQEITLDGKGNLDTLPGYSRQKFDLLLEPCVAESDGVYYFKKPGLMNQAITYRYVDAGGEWHTLADITNAAGMATAEKELDDFFRGKPVTIKPIARLGGIDEGIPMMPQDAQNFTTAELLRKANTNDQIARLGNLESLKIDSVYAPLLKSGDTLLLFDHVNGKLTKFKAPKKNLTTLPIDYQTDEDWVSQVFYDRITRRFYTLFKNNKSFVLKRINVSTGKTDAEYPLKGISPWTKKIKIYNGYLWYLGQDDVNVPNYVLRKVDFQRTIIQN